MPLTIAQVRNAFRNAIPARQDAFKAAVAEANRIRMRRSDMKTWFPQEVLRLAKEETRLRLALARDKVRSLIDSGWSDPMKTVRNAYGDMFAEALGMDKDPSTDLQHAVSNAVWEVRGLPPSDQPHEDKETPLLQELNKCWFDCSEEFIGELECHIPPAAAVATPAPKSSDFGLPVEKAIAAFSSQLAALDSLHNRAVDEAKHDEEEWQNFTQSLIERTFGRDSSQLSRFHAAKHAGTHIVGGVDIIQRQANFVARRQRQTALLKSIISELRLSLPEAEIKGVYPPGEEYAFYRDLSSLIEKAQKSIFIADAYVDDKVFNLYLSRVSGGVPVRMLTNKISANAVTVAGMYAKSNPLELRTSKQFHDRVIFLDDRGWVIGQSIKDAAAKKPTYVQEVKEPDLSPLRKEHETVWSGATVLI